MKKISIAGLALVVPMSFCSSPEAAELPSYSVQRTTEKMVIDGILDEEDWKAALSFGDFVFPWWPGGEKEQTEAKMLWDDNFLYLSFVCQDKHIWADHYNTNSSTYMDDAVELFWNPNPGGQSTYYMFEINCIGNLSSSWRTGPSPRPRILVPHIGRHIYGTVNNDSDTDSHWVMEIAIRFSDYPEISQREVPLAGDLWRIGLNRCGGKVNAQYSQWSGSSTAIPNFHSPDDFGKLFFSDAPVRGQTKAPATGATLPAPIAIRGNFPNPFNPSTSIELVLSRPGPVTLEIFNSVNQKVRTLAEGHREAGTHTLLWDGRDDGGLMVSSGPFIARLRKDGFEVSRKMMMVK
jgi:hypothetical protein